MVCRAPKGLTRWLRLAPVLGVLFGAPSAGLSSPATPPPLAPTERLSYTMYWIGVPVAESMLKSAGPVELPEGRAFHFIATTESNHVLRLLYPVKTRVDSFVEAGRFLPIRYTMTGRQGFRKRDRELRFDQAGQSVTLITEGRSRIYPTVAAVQDPLSAFYYYRMTASLEPGEVARIPVHDRKRPKEIIVTVGQVETVKTKAGTFETVRLKIEQEEGLFLHEGEVWLWMTTDARRLPVRVEARVTLGTVVAELTEVTREEPPPNVPTAHTETAPSPHANQ